MKSGSLKLLEPSGPHRACYGTALPLPLSLLNNKKKLVYCKKSLSFLAVVFYYYWYSALGPVWAETRVLSGDWYGSGTLHPGQVLRGSLPLLSPDFEMFPLFTTRRLHVRHDVRDPSGGSGNCGRECCPVILPKWRLPRHFKDLLHAANLRQGAEGFTSPPKEGVLRIFSPLKIRRLRPGLNPWTWVLKASTLPLDHRSRCSLYNFK